MKILAIDLAATTGAAFGRPQGKPVAWTVDFTRFKDHDARLAQVLRWVRAMHCELLPDLLAVEAAIGGANANALLIQMVGCLRAQAKDLGMATVQYHSGSVRKHFLGKALTSRDFPDLTQAKAKLAIKNKVLVRCKALGWDVVGLDAADACALWSYSCQIEDQSHVTTDTGPLFDGKRS